MTHGYNEIQLTTFLDQIFWRLRLIEAQLTLTARELGMRHHDAASMTPAEVVELLVRAADSHRQSDDALPLGKGGPAAAVPARSSHTADKR